MTPFEIGLFVVSLFLIFGLLFGAYRLLSGPTAADRVVALDLCTILAIGLSAVLAIRAENPYLLDVAMVLALIAFLATVALASLIRSEQPRTEAATPPTAASGNDEPAQPPASTSTTNSEQQEQEG